MTEADILAATYEDMLTVTRTEDYEDAAGRDMQRRVVVLEAVPCALSKLAVKDAVPDDAARIGSARYNYKFFTRPEYRLLEGDQVTVITKTGVVYTGRAGRSFVYPSHADTPMEVHATP